MKGKTINTVSKITVGVVVLSIVYGLQLSKPEESANLLLQNRDLETPLKLWINGYLGVFFKFLAFGNINWLVLLLIIPFWKSANGKNNTIRFFLITTLICTAFLSIYGYFNDRYLGTIAPLILCLIGYILIKNETSIKTWWLLSVLLILNTLFFMGTRFGKQYGKYLGFKSAIATLAALPIKENTNNTLIEINKMCTNQDTFLVLNLPEFYLKTKQFGHYYLPSTDELYTRIGMRKLNQLSSKQLNLYIRDTLNCKYIYALADQLLVNESIQNYINTHCELLYCDPIQRSIYKIKP
jgi:hypothetical protein